MTQWDSDDAKWLKQEMKKRDAMFQKDRDSHNTLIEKEDENLYKHILNADLRIAPKTGQLWYTYLTELKIHLEHACHKNYHTHVTIGARGKPWWTHSRNDNCFMCEDINFMYTMYSTMCLMAQKYSKNRF